MVDMETSYELRTGHRRRTCKEAHGDSCLSMNSGQDCYLEALFCCKICGQAENELAEKCPGRDATLQDI